MKLDRVLNLNGRRERTCSLIDSEWIFVVTSIALITTLPLSIEYSTGVAEYTTTSTITTTDTTIILLQRSLVLTIPFLLSSSSCKRVIDGRQKGKERKVARN